METKFCKDCGAEIARNAEICPKCGCRQVGVIQAAYSHTEEGASPKSRLVCFLLATFLGFLGIHRFYVGKAGTGFLMILTLGGFGIWWIIDWIMILCGNFTDKQNKYIKNWHN